ncbi:uncharacterized protein LOC118644542 [Monomorium pharaonis]|uniref:uncharacterized protein LOC118644542 n=1 Tax=Monomorium pharaonis TaxID=307658 RepID=UPI001747C289|nr:uncharacterized protein LOC118644542 [Monomorium pharaonis]
MRSEMQVMQNDSRGKAHTCSFQTSYITEFSLAKCEIFSRYLDFGLVHLLIDKNTAHTLWRVGDKIQRNYYYASRYAAELLQDWHWHFLYGQELFSAPESRIDCGQSFLILARSLRFLHLCACTGSLD